MSTIIKNRELFQRDPAIAQLMNNGQARIDEGKTEKERQTLREELSNFVCEGQYASGMLRILESYTKSVASASQPAAWVSGFYGSGKSHLLKMLSHLWVNTEFPEDGATARSLVPPLPGDIEAALRELDILGKRCGGLYAASGTLPAGGGSAVRPTVLGIVLRAVGFPESYPQARFCLYLKGNGFFEKVKAAVEKSGKDFGKELNNLYVSPVLHDALIAVDAGFRNRPAVRDLLKQEFPQREDVTTAEFIQMIRDVLSQGKQLPCTIIVLDEVQLFIADSSERTTQVIEVAEALCKQLDSRILLVSAGQTALSNTPQLQKLRDRFTIPVELSDTDVESVTRRVLLAKRPDRVEAIRQNLATHAGEIDRQLASTGIGRRSEDNNFLIEDYPLLPVRRRFWEHVFRAVDTAGTSGQLRTQLRIVYEALRRLADAPLGTVVPADFMFEQLQPGLLGQGVLLHELDDTIRKLDDGTPDGQLARRLCGLIFLIRKLPRQPGIDIGVRATPGVLADLLVSDLTSDGARLRKEVPRILEGLVNKAVLLDVEGECALQTRESAEWDKEFRIRQNRLNSNDVEIHAKREALLRDAAGKALGGIKLQQGASKEPRKLAIHFGDEPPNTSGHEIPIWVRDGWSCGEKEFHGSAQAAGLDSPIVFVFLPKASADDLRKRIVDSEAARGTLDFKGVPTASDGPGREAYDAMKTRRDLAAASRDELIRGILDVAKVFKGGGTESFGLTFDEKVRIAAQDALERLFPRFREADHKNWSVAINRARNGDDSPLQAIDWSGPVDEHPVCKEILREIGAGKDGRALRRTFGDSPYGWPQDATDGALIVLHAAGRLQARHKGSPLVPGQLDQAKITASDFRTETISLSAHDKLKLRSLFQEAGVLARPSEDLSVKSGEYLSLLKSLAQSAGGDPPLPERPTTTHLDDLRTLAGNEQLAQILAHHDRLKAEAAGWKSASELAANRFPVWQRLHLFLEHARNLPAAADLRSQADAISAGRLLLDTTDRSAPLLKKTADLLRNAVTEACGRYKHAYELECQRLDAKDAWKHLTNVQREQILTEEGISALPAISMGSDDQLLRTLDSTSLPSWGEKRDALAQRFANAAIKAAKLLEPKTQNVRLTSGALRTEEDVKAWLKQQEQELLRKLKDGPIIIN